MDEESHYSSRKRDREEDQREFKRLVAIQARKEACRKVREARQRKDATLNIRWKDYMDKRKDVKKLLRREKKELRRKTKIREQGGASSKLFWSDLDKRKRKRRNIPRLKSKMGRVGGSGRRASQALGGVGKHE